ARPGPDQMQRRRCTRGHPCSFFLTLLQLRVGPERLDVELAFVRTGDSGPPEGRTAMPRADAASDAMWVSKAKGHRMLTCTYDVFNKRVAAGAIGVLHVPHAHPRYSRSDIERLARASVKPAKVQVEAASC